MPSGKKRKGHKMATHKRKKRLRKTDIRRKSNPFTFLSVIRQTKDKLLTRSRVCLLPFKHHPVTHK